MRAGYESDPTPVTAEEMTANLPTGPAPGHSRAFGYDPALRRVGSGSTVADEFSIPAFFKNVRPVYKTDARPFLIGGVKWWVIK